MTRPTSFAEFNAVPATGPTYTELAREVEALKEENERLKATNANLTSVAASQRGMIETRDWENERLRALHGPDGLCQWYKEFRQEQSRRVKAEAQVATLVAGQQRIRIGGLGIGSTLHRMLWHRARASGEDKDKGIDRLKENNAALLDFARYWEGGLEDVVENGGGADLGWMDRAKAAEMLAVIRADHPGTALAAEVERLRSQVATLISGQQRNGEARQQAVLDLAHELAEISPAARDAAIRRIIDRSTS